ncbi:MAG TPA: hypothetical protein VKQ08_01200, partial [Cyclobacteriaceae bacterium]|nr:hypothetical protein [Cyclobacteriaceae bacterium]
MPISLGKPRWQLLFWCSIITNLVVLVVMSRLGDRRISELFASEPKGSHRIEQRLNKQDTNKSIIWMKEITNQHKQENVLFQHDG